MSKPKRTCPLGHECHLCIWQVHLLGTNPQTGETINDERCAIAWLPLLSIEVSQQVRQGAAATESMRNEMVVLNKINGEVVANQTAEQLVTKLKAERERHNQISANQEIKAIENCRE